MRWNIQGADRDDGSDIALTVVARTKANAIAKANARGVLVAEVAPAEDHDPIPNDHAAPGPDAPSPRSSRTPCPNCAELVAADATLCPFCKQPIFSRNKGQNALVGVLVSVALFFVLYFAISAFVQHEADKDFRRIMDQSERETDRLMRQYEGEATEQMRRINREAQAETERMMRQAERDADAMMRTGPVARELSSRMVGRQTEERLGMAREDSWIRVRIRNRATGAAICLYHPPKLGKAGEDVDREIRAILGIPSPQPAGYKAEITVEALPGPADWLTAKVPAHDVPADHCV